MPSTVARPMTRVQEAETPVNRGSTRDGRGPLQVVLLGMWWQFSRVQEAIMPSPVGLRGVLPAPIRRSVDRVWKRDYIVFSTLTVPAQNNDRERKRSLAPDPPQHKKLF